MDRADVCRLPDGIIRTDGSLWGWGKNDYGQLGNGTYNFINYPVKITSAASAASVSPFAATE